MSMSFCQSPFRPLVANLFSTTPLSAFLWTTNCLSDSAKATEIAVKAHTRETRHTVNGTRNQAAVKNRTGAKIAMRQLKGFATIL